MRICTDRFGYKNKVFSEEMSTLSGGTRTFSWTRLYSDACDVGVVLVSQKTSKEVRYYLHDTHKDNDNDVQYWELLPCTEDVRKNPGVKNTKIMIWND
jgi:hypothetical protein